MEVLHPPDPSETLTLLRGPAGLAQWWEERSGPLTEAHSCSFREVLEELQQQLHQDNHTFPPARLSQVDQ